MSFRNKLSKKVPQDILNAIPDDANEDQIYFYLWSKNYDIKVPERYSTKCVKIIIDWLGSSTSDYSDIDGLRPLGYTTNNFKNLFKYVANRGVIFEQKITDLVYELTNIKIYKTMYNLLEKIDILQVHQIYALVIIYLHKVNNAFTDNRIVNNFISSGPVPPFRDNTTIYTRWMTWTEKVDRMERMEKKEKTSAETYTSVGDATIFSNRHPGETVPLSGFSVNKHLPNPHGDMNKYIFQIPNNVPKTTNKRVTADTRIRSHRLPLIAEINTSTLDEDVNEDKDKIYDQLQSLEQKLSLLEDKLGNTRMNTDIHILEDALLRIEKKLLESKAEIEEPEDLENIEDVEDIEEEENKEIEKVPPSKKTGTGTNSCTIVTAKIILNYPRNYFNANDFKKKLYQLPGVIPQHTNIIDTKSINILLKK